jgi:uncharacterized UPF0160 family protein
MDKKKIVTHNGKFHADDVFAVATLQLMFGVENIEVVRTRDEENIQGADIVVDVGMEHDSQRQRFDHHQQGGAGKRDNGIQYASFGLVWKEFGRKLVTSEDAWRSIDERLVQVVDAGDNGIETYTSVIEDVFPYTVSSVISSFCPSWKEKSDYLKEFNSAVSFARELLEREIKKANHFQEAKEKIVSVYEGSPNKKCIVFGEEDTFGREIIANALSAFDEPLFAILFRPDVDSWQLVTIPIERGTFKNRKSLPESWAGLRDEKLDEVTGVSGGIFCHRSGFMAVTKTKEGVLKLAQKALEEGGK